MDRDIQSFRPFRLSPLLAFGLLGAALLLPLEEAHAYLDPGSGSAILQVLLAGFAGVAVAGKLFWQHLWHWARRKPTGTGTEKTSAE